MPGDCVLGIDCDKNTSGPLTTWTQCIHDIQSIISCLTSGTVLVSLYAVVLLNVGEGGGGRKVQ